MADRPEARMRGLFRTRVRSIASIRISAGGLFQIAALLAVFILAGCASPNPAVKTVKVIAPRRDCTLSESVPTTLEDFLSHPDRLIDKCIHVRGFVAFRDVFPSLPWFYEHPNSDKRVAVYGEDPPGGRLWTMRNYADLVGFAYSCEQFEAFAEAQAEQDNEEARKNGSGTESIPFLAGSCHYRVGPVLWVSQITVDESSPNRLFGQAAAQYASLTPMRPGTPHATEIADTIGPMFELMRKQDKAGFEAHLRKIVSGGLPYYVDDAFDPKQSPFAFLFGAPKAPDVHYFVPKARARGAAGNFVAIGCLCKTDSCDGQWPISEMDARNKQEWPYSCIGLTKEDTVRDVYLH